MENDNQNSLPTQPPVPQPVQSWQLEQSPQPPIASDSNLYVGNGPGGRAKQMPSRNRLLFIAATATVLVLATGGYVFGYYMPNRPSTVFKSALANTADGYDQLVKYASNSQTSKVFENTQVDGTYKIDTTGFSTDGTFTAHADKNNATFSGDLGLGTTRLKIDGIVKSFANSQTPDTYLKVSGIKGIGANLNMPALDALDNQWITIDHTFLTNLTKQMSQGQSTGGSGSVAMPTEADAVAAAQVIGSVSRKYVFSTSSSTGVFQMSSFVGKETVDGKSTNHYKVSANKAHLKAYVTELGAQLDKTKLNDWAKTSYGKSLSSLLDVESMKSSVDNIKTGDTFDLWVNTKTKLAHKIRISDSKDAANSYFDLGLNYNGGAEKPFFLATHSKSGSVVSDVTFGLSINTDTNAVKLNVDAKTDSNGASTTMTADMTAKPTTTAVNVTVPTGAISLFDAMSRAGLSNYYNLLNSSLGAYVQSSTQQTATNPYALSL